MVGQKVGRLTIMADLGLDKNSHRLLLCVCSCGNSKTYVRSDLLTGRIVACGCRQRESGYLSFKHGEARHRMVTPEYQTWLGMIKRCEDDSRKDYKHYGARGIKVCARWRHSFETFLADMGRRPLSKPTLDRINNDGNYEPGNCRWATWSQQNLNKRVLVSEGL
jgi:hypothetical protein